MFIQFTIDMSQGIPIIYYLAPRAPVSIAKPSGLDASDPTAASEWESLQRSCLWEGGYAQIVNNSMYQFIKRALWYRKNLTTWDYPMLDLYVDRKYYAFSRGPAVLASR